MFKYYTSFLIVAALIMVLCTSLSLTYWEREDIQPVPTTMAAETPVVNYEDGSKDLIVDDSHNENYIYRCNGTGVHDPPRYALASFLVGSGPYLTGAVTLGKSILHHFNHEDVGMYLMVLESTHLNYPEWEALSEAGWSVCKVPLIEPFDVNAVFGRFRQQFTKLALFTWTEFERIVYLDADTVVLGDLSEMFRIGSQEQDNGDFMACPDYESGHAIEEFNMGVFSLVPNHETFADYLNQAKTRSDYRLDTAEQGLLRDIYSRVGWTRMPITYNGPLGMYMSERAKWDAQQFRVIHYTEVKPFNLAPDAAEWNWEPMQIWRAEAGYFDSWRCQGYPAGKREVVTSLLVSEEGNYLWGAVVLGNALRTKVNLNQTDLILMVLAETELSEAAAADLRASGWQLCRVPVIESGFQELVLERFRKIFVKLAPYTWTGYDRFVFMDLDTLPVGNLGELLDPKEKDCSLKVTLDYENGAFQEHFNSGVFASCPDLRVFAAFMSFLKTRHDYRIIMGDQGILNKMAELGTVWVTHLPMELNANLAIYEQDRNLWRQREAGIKVIHYTTAKPFNLIDRPDAPERQWEPIKLWFQHYYSFMLTRENS